MRSRFSDSTPPPGRRRPYGGPPVAGPPPRLLAPPGAWSFTTWLIVINVAVFVVDRLLKYFVVYYEFGPFAMGPLEYWGHFSATAALQYGQLWRVITFQFLHANLIHILFNMFMLYFFGKFIERYLGPRRFLAFYLICGVAGAAGYLLLLLSGWLVTAPGMPLVGASAGIFGVLMAAAFVAPDADVYIYGVLPVKLRHLALLLIGLAVYTIVFFGEQPGHNAGGEAAHLGGALMGLLLIRRPVLLNWARKLGPREPKFLKRKPPAGR